MEIVIYLSLVTASISFTVSEAKIFLPLREWAQKRSSYWGSLLSCGYCFGHWVAFALVALYRPRLFELWWLLDYFLTALVISWLSAFQWIAMCWLMGKAGK
ncbi:MAG: hypothetical protein H6557_21025 [Lewinellaceae bacterium]|nr:hypothetical protein [Phaeodactylibacter sp.]MCB9039103.1 hypothetical protein [Lewinellaceae bacterium]